MRLIRGRLSGDVASGTVFQTRYAVNGLTKGPPAECMASVGRACGRHEYREGKAERDGENT
jgi:hypothetical protein